jgi:hypothetical protein
MLRTIELNCRIIEFVLANIGQCHHRGTSVERYLSTYYQQEIHNGGFVDSLIGQFVDFAAKYYMAINSLTCLFCH